METQRRLLTRRQFFWSAGISLPTAAVADSIWIEPGWLKVKRLQLRTTSPSHRVVHFTDLHHKGDRSYLEKVVAQINALKPDLVCFTGDIIEEDKHLAEALRVLRDIKAPLYGCPGNHDYWADADFDEIAEAFAATGGAWLVEQSTTTRDGKVTIFGGGKEEPRSINKPSTAKSIALVHYPEWADHLGAVKFDIVLAGHTHGGQIRIPFYGALIVPWGTGNYELGLFNTKAGSLYVSSGVGWFALNVRFLCRPEIVCFEI